jgi:hypothetical protein
MQGALPEPDASLCACGRSLATAATSTYRSPSGRYTFRRCVCGVEWTERADTIDPAEPVTGDEVLDVHQHLAGFEGSLRELLDSKQQASG